MNVMDLDIIFAVILNSEYHYNSHFYINMMTDLTTQSRFYELHLTGFVRSVLMPAEGSERGNNFQKQYACVIGPRGLVKYAWLTVSS